MMTRRTILILFCLLAAIAGKVFADSAVILELSGSVNIVSMGSDRASPAITGQALVAGDAVSTGSDGSVVILLADGSRIDLFPNSRLMIRDSAQSTDESGFLGRLWRSITGKFADARDTSAQAGGVGAFRSRAHEEELFDDYVTQTELSQMRGLLEELDGEDLPESAADLMRAIIYENYGQFVQAHEIYMERIDQDPDDPVTYDLVFDMYLKMELYGRAAEIAELKNARFPPADK